MQREIFNSWEATAHARYTPRDYQAAGIDKTFELWADHAGVLFRQPTGTGKTVSGILIADRWLALGDDRRVLVVANERQLIQQFAGEIETILGVRPAIEMGDSHCSGDEKIIVASRQTLRGFRLQGKFDASLKWLLIIDEAHRWAAKLKSCAPILEHFARNTDSRRLGLTATPDRADKTSFASIFPAIATDYRLYNLEGGPSAVGDGWAVPYDQRFVKVSSVDFRAIKTVAKDFDKKELERVLSQTETLAKLIEPTLDLVGNRKTLIFSPGIDMARAVALYINAKLCQDAAIYIDGSYEDADRRRAYKLHQRGDVQFLSVCGLCREGYNDPTIQAVAIFRPTKSRALAEQMRGRGCRPLRGVVSPDMSADERRRAIANSIKPNCMIVDLVGITGLGDCASTAHILGSAKPDAVIELANAIAIDQDGPIDMIIAIAAAEAQLAAEQAKRAKRAEAARKRAERRRAKLDEDQEEYRRRAKLDPSVEYQATAVEAGRGGRGGKPGSLQDPASEKQRGYIAHLGLDLGSRQLSKAQASRVISQLRNGVDPLEVLRTNRFQKPQPKPPAMPPESFESLLSDFRGLQ